ncbi:DUF2922 domain-containing protein [Bacillus sp. B15-48]|uniref:DUF2922 domain-containing protein n=1 Tax=Bacillus sp. B15-48 TaxID=1548601 RepID=UPI00193F507F|nr:DUF2922 domain-containing protein [Bacillus sp. B15-48]MBM4761012.1 DUF2922 family protein [Bacillus sp. B15-48]
MTKTLELQFVTDLGKTARLTVENPTEPINEAAVKTAMESIIEANAFFSSQGNLVAVGGARVIERNVIDYEIV